MKLATLPNGLPDGALAVVSRDLSRAVRVPDIAPTLQAALDRWTELSPRLAETAAALERGDAAGAEGFDPAAALAPLPRAYQWCDGSTYPGHMERMAEWRGLPVPEAFWTEPFLYQGGSDGFLGPGEDIPCVSTAFGVDFEAEVCVVTDAVPLGTDADGALDRIRLVMVCNDVSLRNLIPHELEKGFGFVQSKPASAFSPVAVTPDELGGAWRDGRVHLTVRSTLNGTRMGDPDAGEMQFGFHELIAYVARTRSLAPGSIIGSGTVASRDPARGVSCLTEQRIVETLEQGAPRTEYLRPGDHVRIEMVDDDDIAVCGAIDQRVAAVPG
jgi:fumarylacetoacetate (FAA) hydrolase